MSKSVRLINKLIGILSLEDIESLTTVSEGKEKIPLTLLVSQQFITGTSESTPNSIAQILPFAPVSKEVTAETAEKNPEMEKPQEIENTVDEKDEAEQGKIGMAVFILNQRKKFEPNHKKLKAKEIMNSYMKNAAIDINEERKLKEDLRQSSNSGILVNKRQF